MSDSKRIQVELTAIDKNLSTVLGQSGAAMSKFEATGKLLESRLSTIGKVFGTVTAVWAGTAFFKDAIDKTKEMADEVKHLKEAFGITPEQASVLRVALDDTFVSSEQLTGASARLTRQLATNEAAVNNLGVATRDANGNFRPQLEILTDINSVLLKFQEGTDRNIEGMKIYGKGWEEARSTLKLTTKAMEEARDRAAELGVVFSGDRLDKIKEYKKAMKDLDDVLESLQVRIGSGLIPSLTLFAEHAGKGGVVISQYFGAGIKEGIELVEKLTVSLAAGLDKLDAMRNVKVRIDFSGVQLVGLEEYNRRIEAIDTAAMEQWKEIEKGFLPKSSSPGGKRSTGGVMKESDWTAANNKYLEYLKAFEEKKAAIVRAGAELELRANQTAWEWGLKGLIEYIDDEYRIKRKAIDAEIAAKQQEVDNIRAALGNLQPSYGSKGESRPDKDASNRWETMKKLEDAERSLIEAQSKDDIAAKEYERDRNLRLIDATANATQAALEQAQLNGEYGKAQQLQEDLLSLEEQRAKVTGKLPEEIALIVRKREELERMRTPTGALAKGFADVARQWGDAAKNMEEVGQRTAQAMRDSFSDLFFDAMQGKLKSLGDYVNSFMASMERSVANMLGQQMTSGLLGLAGGIGDVLGGIFGNAQGNVFTAPALSAYSGKVVVKPTLFPFARGIGLMGEAGPEAIMPLKRMGSGRLGVETTGAGGNVVVNVIEAPGKGGQVNQRRENGVNIIEVVVEQVKRSIASDVVQGNGVVPAAFSTAYGLRRIPGR